MTESYIKKILYNKLIFMRVYLLGLQDEYKYTRIAQDLEKVIAEIGGLLLEIIHDPKISAEYVIQRKHNIMLRLIEFNARSSFVFLPLIEHFVVRYEASYIGVDSTHKFGNNFLGMALFDDIKKFKAGKIHEDEYKVNLIKYLIENGNDVVYAAQYFLSKQSNTDISSPELRQRFNQAIGMFFRTTHTARVEALIRSASCDHGFYIKRFKCVLSGKIPILPVFYKGRIYDLFDLSVKLGAKSGRTSPYEFILDGIEIDSHIIQFYSEYSTHILKELDNKNAYKNLYDQIRTLLFYNRSFSIMAGGFLFATLMLMQLINLFLINAHETKLNSSQERKIVLDMIVRITPNFLPLAYDRFNYAIRTHSNPYISRLGIFNFLYAFSMGIGSFYLSLSGKYESITVFPVLPFSTLENNLAFNLIAGYGICLPFYIAASLTHSKDLEYEHDLYEEPRIRTISPVFDKQKYIESQCERNHQKMNLTLCLNKWVATSKTQPQLAGNAKEPNPLLEKILDYNFGENFVRHKYR